MNVKVSIIVPVYNSEKTIVRCATNLVNQTLKEIEIIFIDDCSTDSSFVLLQEIKKQFPYKVKVLKTQENSGPGGARNLGLEYVDGEYIGFVDSDDIADVTMYQKLYERAVEEQCDIVDSAFIDEKRQCIVSSLNSEFTGILDNEKRKKLISKEGYIWCKLFKSTCIQNEQVRFREKCIMEDTDFIMYLYATVTRIGKTDDVLYKHCWNNDSLMETINAQKTYYQSRETMSAIYKRLSGVTYYDDIKEGVEAMIIGLYLCAVTNCIESADAPDFNILKELQELSELKKKTVTGGYDNSFLVKTMDDNCINIMKLNDEAPEELGKICIGSIKDV